MAKLSPVQRVRADHKSKEELATKVLGLLQAPEGEEQESFERRIRTMSNTKLLRLWNAYQTMNSEYGSREALIEKIVKGRFPNGNEPYQTKISGYTVPRLLDLARSAS